MAGEAQKPYPLVHWSTVRMMVSFRFQAQQVRRPGAGGSGCHFVTQDEADAVEEVMTERREWMLQVLTHLDLYQKQPKRKRKMCVDMSDVECTVDKNVSSPYQATSRRHRARKGIRARPKVATKKAFPSNYAHTSPKTGDVIFAIRGGMLNRHTMFFGEPNTLYVRFRDAGPNS